MKWRRKRKYKKRSHLGFKLRKNTVYTVGAIWLWLFAGIITLSFFGEGPVLLRLREELMGRIGYVYFLLPPFLVLLSMLFFNLKSDWGKPNVPLGFGLIMMGLIGLTQSGTVGEMLRQVISGATSFEVAIAIFISVFVMGLVVLFNASLEKAVNFGLLGLQTLWELVKTFLKKFVSKGSPDFTKESTRQIKIKGIDDEKPVVKAPMTPPPVAGTKGVPAMAKTEGFPVGTTTNKPEEIYPWVYPDISLLSEAPREKADRGDKKRNASIIETTLDSFGIRARIMEVNEGPAVTQYCLKPASGTKLSKITSLSSDLALALAAPTGAVRIEAPIPGRDLVGIEIPNRGLEFVTLKRMLTSAEMGKAKSKLSVALGLDVSGTPVVTEIGRMPHVLVAGTTGSGKSVLLNSWICSLLFRTTPKEVRLILIDPKRVELIGYNGVPHLLTPVIVEKEKILSALHWAVTEMEQRYKQFAEVKVRNIDSFNEFSGFQALPYIVIIIDELAELMAYAPADVEDSICRVAQMARATGIHLVIATQRPSIEVITGLIKANIPCRIAFNVSTMIDSRVIIDMPGAEKLLGRGDMLFVPPEQSKPARIQGTFVSEQEVAKVVEFLRAREAPVEYTEEVTTTPVHIQGRSGGGESGSGSDQLFEDALRLVCQYDKASASLLQRRLSIGYARAARILDQLEAEGVIGPAEGAKPRDVFIKDPNEFLAQRSQQT